MERICADLRKIERTEIDPTEKERTSIHLIEVQVPKINIYSKDRAG